MEWGVGRERGEGMAPITSRLIFLSMYIMSLSLVNSRINESECPSGDDRRWSLALSPPHHVGPDGGVAFCQSLWDLF